MKTISKRFLKGGLAILLAVMMLFSSTITGFAAVVDNADTSADVDVSATGADIQGYIYYDNSLTKWTSVQILLGHSTWSEGYQMTKIANTDIWYYNMSSKWGGATQIAVFNASSKWGGEGKSVSARIQYMDKNSACKTFSTSYTSGLLLYGTSGSDNFTLSMTSKTYSGLNANQTANVYSAAAGSSTFSADSNAGTVTVSGRYLSSATASATRSASSTLDSTSTATASLARGTTVTMTATANDGYTFVGWYNSSGTQQTTSTTFTYTGTGSTATYTARFQAEPTYTATFKDWDGSVIDTQTGLKNGDTPAEPAAPTRDGYNFTGWEPSISAINGADQTYTAQYQLAATCSPVMSDLTLDVNETGTVTATTNEHCTAGGTFTYSLVTPDDGIISLNGNSVQAFKPGTTKVKATCACGNTVTCDVTVNTPDVSLTPETVKLIVGQTMTDAFVTTADGNPTISLGADTAEFISISGNKATALKAGTATVTALFKYNELYTAEATATVTVAAPKITANPTSVALEFGDGSTTTSKTVTLTPNTADGNGTGDDITVTSTNANVATATLNGTTLTINATGIGSTTVTAKFHDATVEIPVTVTQYDPYVYLYVTDNNSWGSMYVYSWKGSSTVITPITTSMIYIGKNGDGKNIFAYRFSKTNLPQNVIFAKNSSWGSQTADTAINWNNTNHRALYFASSSDKSTMKDWTSDCMIVRPTVSVADVVVPVAGTETATATVENGGKVLWKSQGTTIATVADVDTQTSTVTGVTPGETTITARAFIDTANSSIKTLPTNYKTQTSCWPYISTEATATVTVGSVDYDITANASYSDNGTDYNAGANGGTVSITVDGEDLGTSASVAHGKDYTLTAIAAANYRFVGWYKDGAEVSTTASYTVNAEAAASYTAKFVKTYKVSVILGTGIELIKFNNVSYNQNFDNLTVDAGASITVYATPAPGYAFKDWTVEGATVADNTIPTLTIENVQDSITLTANAVSVYTATATAQTNKYFGTYGGTVTIDGKSSPVQYKNGDTVTFEAHNNTNYYFDGWYTDAEFTNKVSADAEYEVTMTEAGITLYALFVKNFYITNTDNENIATFVYNVADNSYTVTGEFTDHFTVTSNDAKDVTSTDVNVTGGTHTGCTVAGHYTSYQVTADTENYDITAPVTYTLTPDIVSGTPDGTYTMSIALSDAEKVAISVNGTKVADKAIGSTFSYEITAPEGQYLSGATTTPAVDFEIVDGKIEFTVPDSNVNIVPEFTNYSYVTISDTTGITVEGLKEGYKAGENDITITLSPATEATTISGVTTDNDAAVASQNSDGSWTVTIASMPADTTITLTPTVDAKFKMDYGTAAIGNYGSGYTTYGTVAMKIGDTAIAKGGYAGPTDTVTYTATPNTNFIFDGWYSDSACSVGSLVSRNTSYDVTPTGDTTLYALFVPKHYIAEDQAKVTDHKEMTYDPATRSFKYTSSTMNAGAWFRVSNNPTTSYWTDSSSYCIFDSSFNVTFNANAYMATVGWGTQCYALSVDSSAIKPYEIIVELNGNSSIDVSCKAAKDGSHIYLSSGRVDVPGSYKSAVFDATTKFTDEDITNPTDTLVQNEGETREKYKKLKITEPRTVTFETTITGTAASNYYVDKFVVYHIESERYEIVTPNPMGNNVYQGSVYVESDCYIVPIYFVTEAYATANNLAQIDIYFDATAIKDQAWGPFVACYAWGTNSAEYFGGWSAQLMIPTEDGTSFYTMVTVPAKGNTTAGNVPNGVTFNNYTQSTVPGSNPGAFGISATQYQCYDYREPITLYEAGYEVITFVAKDSTDGYHGDRANGVTANTVSSSTTDIFNKYDFDYLYCRDGVTPMDLNGNAIENPTNLETGKADYYIVNKGDITYDPNGTKYVGDSNFDADWAVDWYVFDKDGKYITNILSTAMWDDKTDSIEDGLYTYLHEALKLTADDVAGKTVAISYEHENNAGHQVSYDGQWYGNMLDHKVIADVKVGVIDGDQFVIDDDNINETYGEGYVIDVEGDGGKYQSVEISLDLGEVSLSATTTTNNYYFAGWYTYANGKYTQIGKSLDYTTYISNNQTYYAMFREVGEDQVVFNHMVYNNPTDQFIPSHGGTATMWIEIYEGNTLISKGTPSTSSSTAMINAAKDGTTYTVKVYTTPLMNGEFFAWYTDSETADGTKTYEEILTLDGHIDKTTTVESSFEYTYTYDAQKITNIYSDVTRVSNKANLFFKYKNRYGEWRTYTVRDIELTDQECMGYDGNGGNAYYPTYLTKYVMENIAGTQVTVYGEKAMEAKKTEGYDVISTENYLQQYAPSSDVTEVFNGTVNWTIGDTTIKPGKSMITIEADQGEPTYTIRFTAGTQSGTRTGEYNTLATIEPDAEYQGATFSHWEEKDNESGEWVFLTYNKRYSYRIVEDKEIRAVYGDKLTEDWVPSIDSVTYTREYQDTSDIIYTDFLLAYNSKTGVKLNDVKDAQNIKYGLLMVMDPSYRYDGNGDVKYLDPSEANLITAAEYGKNKLIDGIRYYNFDLTKLTLTNFNRCDYFKQFDNRDTTNNYKGVAYTCYAYLIKDGKVYLSNPENVNFYELAMEDVTSSQ